MPEILKSATDTFGDHASGFGGLGLTSEWDVYSAFWSPAQPKQLVGVGQRSQPALSLRCAPKIMRCKCMTRVQYNATDP
ncbi:hypothetical protein ACLOJK_032400 [Asimina triloba]